MRKFLIFLIIILSAAVVTGISIQEARQGNLEAENSALMGTGLLMKKEEGEITNVLTTYHFFSSYAEVNTYLRDSGIVHVPVEGYSECWRNVDQNIAYCDIFMVRPTEIDGEHTLTSGHEQWHGVYGSEFHDVEGY